LKRPCRRFIVGLAAAAFGVLFIVTVLPAAEPRLAESPLVVVDNSHRFELLTGEPNAVACEPEQCPDISTVGPAVCPDGMEVAVTACGRKPGEACGWKYACEPEHCVVPEGYACEGPTECACAAGFICERSPHAPAHLIGFCIRALPCEVAGRTYQPGERYACDCNICQCVSGEHTASTAALCRTPS
jgi:hypothetical protein